MENNKASTFQELSKAKIQEKRNLVISKNSSDEGFTLAQQILVEEGNRITTIFMKGATQIDGIESLYNVRDAINEAISKYEFENK